MSRNSDPGLPFLFLDAGFTLIYPNPSVGHFYARLAAEHGIVADPKALDEAFFQAWRTNKIESPAHPKVPYGVTLEDSRRFWSAVVEKTFQLAGHPPPDRETTFYNDLFDLFAGPDCWALYPDVPEGLEMAAAAGLRLGVLSNWDRRLSSVIEGLGLLDRFQVVITSSEAGAEKPSPEIFQYARRQLAGITHFALIGDEQVADGRGAMEAGWTVCLLNRGGKIPEGELPVENNLPAAVRRILTGAGTAKSCR